MKLKDILKKVGAGIFRDAVPGGGMILDVIGYEGDKSTATGNDLKRRCTADDLSREFDIKLEEIKQEGETLRAMLAADAKSTHTTRPYIAKHSFHVLALVTLALVGALLWAVGKTDDPLKELIAGWPFVVSLLVPFVALLRAYFGMLSVEHKNRLDSAHGATNPSGIAGLFANLFKR